MSQGTLIDWKNESEAIHNEMDRLLASGWQETAEERQVRKMQFMALIERRDVAARGFLQPLRNASRFSAEGQKPKEAVLSARINERTSEVKIVTLTLSQPSSEPAASAVSTVDAKLPELAEDERLNLLMATELK
jgi:hypothetical protein